MTIALFTNRYPRLNLRNPITRGLAFCVLYSQDGLQNLVNGERPVMDAAARATIGAAGKSYYAAANPKIAAWTSSSAPSSDGTGLGSYTMLSFSAPPNESNISCLLSQSAGSATEQALFLANTNTGFGASAGRVTFGDGSGGAYTMVQTPDTPLDGYPHVLVGGRGAGVYWIDIDGGEKILTSGLTHRDIYLSGSSEIYASGIKGYTTYTRAHPHFLQAIWNRELTKSERAAIGMNPWLLLEPIRRHHYAVPAVAVTTGNHRIVGGGWGGRVISYREGPRV